MSNAMLMLLVLLAGAGLVVQVGMNATLGTAARSMPFAMLANFTIGTLAMLALMLAVRGEWPGRSELSSVPAWAWMGGLIGALYVASATLAGPKIGAMALLALSVGGQIVASLLIDHYGWLGFPRDPLSASRVLGAALVFGGVLLVAR